MAATAKTLLNHKRIAEDFSRRISSMHPSFFSLQHFIACYNSRLTFTNDFFINNIF